MNNQSPQDDTEWTPRPNLTRRFWVGCVVMLFSVSLLIATLILNTRTPDGASPIGQIIVALLVTAFGARLALSQGNLAALKARFS